jgi:hypothetical protein
MKRLVLILATLAILGRITRRARHARTHHGGPPRMFGPGHRRGRFAPSPVTV